MVQFNKFVTLLTNFCALHILFLKNNNVSFGCTKLLNFTPSEAYWILLQCSPFHCSKSVDPLYVSYNPDSCGFVCPLKNVSKSPVKSYIRSTSPTLSNLIQLGIKLFPSVVKVVSYPNINSRAVIWTIGCSLALRMTKLIGRRTKYDLAETTWAMLCK